MPEGRVSTNFIFRVSTRPILHGVVFGFASLEHLEAFFWLPRKSTCKEVSLLSNVPSNHYIALRSIAALHYKSADNLSTRKSFQAMQTDIFTASKQNFHHTNGAVV